ncbi:MAG: PEGA domain-containing protein [Candidatus Gracilibacteria bacterium]|nr:PEGA domain-containing protein [Candidatus Gracilibacteria bacterium]
MSNRTLGFLIIFGFIAGSFLFYQYFFVFKLVSLTVNSNVENYTVELNNLKASKKIECVQKVCHIAEISPFEYNIKITKDDYKTYLNKIDLSSNETLNVNLEKNVVLEKIEINNPQNISEQADKRTRQEIIDEINKRKETYKIINIEDIGEFIFKKNLGKLDLYLTDNKIGTFELVKPEDISIKLVYSAKDYIVLSIGNKKYFINYNFFDVRIIDLNIDIAYVKKSFDNFTYQIVTDKGTFIYSLGDNSLEYFSKFSDFIILDKFLYIALIKNNDITRKKNFGFENKPGDLIVYFDEKTGEKILIKETNIQIEKLLYEENDIIVLDINGSKYKLKNFN